jgi:hypothetical protein
MSLRYYVLGSVVLFGVLYFTKEMRDLRLPASITGSSEPLASESAPRHMLHTPQQDKEETRRAIKERTALEEWIQSRLTQQGLKEMTESGHWQSEQSASL